MISKRIKEVRRYLNYNSQKDFANILEIPASTLQKYEQGKVNIPHTFLNILNRKFNVSIDWLLSGKGEMFINQKVTLSEYKKSKIDEIMEIIKNLPLIEQEKLFYKLKLQELEMHLT